MTIKELAAVMANDTTYTVYVGVDQEVVIAGEDKALMAAFGDVVVDHAMVNTSNRLCIFPVVELRRETV